MNSQYPDQARSNRDWKHQGTSLRKDIIIEYSDMQSEHIQMNIPYHSEPRVLDLGQVLHNHFSEVIPQGYEYQIFYYSNNSEYFIFGGLYPFEQLLLLGEEFISENYIFVKLNRTHPPVVQEIEEPSKKKRKNDRTIKDVLEKVAQWRKIQQQNSVTLEEAAKTVDIPKKTLDDYFWQIKQAQTYGFDFEQHLSDKIGVLRKFVRDNHKRQQNESQFKIIQQFMKEGFNDDDKMKENDSENQEFQSGQQ